MLGRFSRRVFVGSASSGAASLLWPRRATAQGQGPSGGLPGEVTSFDLGLLDDWLTPNDLFFVRNHFAVPQLSAHQWKLAFSGAVSAPFELSYDDLAAERQERLTATLECAENPVGGGLVSNAKWSGVSLAALLKKAGLRAEARFVRFWAADGATQSSLGYTRSIPISKAMSPDSLLALRMNGEPLPAAHGFPARAILPRWYAMDSVKWLRKVEVLTDVGNRAIMTAAYQRQRRSGAVALPREPISTMKVKSVFSRPLDGAILMGRRFIVRGAAWAGVSRVRQVEISSDGGQSWHAAQLEPNSAPSARQPSSWVFWNYVWRIPSPGEHELIVRAMDERGQLQPAARDKERIDAYEQNSYQHVRCTATATVRERTGL